MKGGNPFKKAVWLLIFTLKSYICIGIIGVSDVDCRFALGRFLAGYVLMWKDNFITCAWTADFGSLKGFPKDKTHRIKYKQFK